MALVDISRQAFFPSERVDLEPLQKATAGSDVVDGYALQLQKQIGERFIIDDLPRIVDGFRVEIPNQTTSPGNFTVHNGVAFNRLGIMVENASDIDASRTANLPLATTLYYIEVELAFAQSGTDARAFWNPTYANGTDPSGDTRAPGREYTRNTATVYQCDWSIKTSTTGFAYNVTNLNSVRIPLCVLKTDSSGTPKIVATTTVTKTVLRQTIAVGATAALCVDTRHLPDSFTGLIGASAVTITANDRENHVLTLSAGIGAQRAQGSLVVPDSGSTQWLQDRGATFTDKPVPDPTGLTAAAMWDVSSISADTRPRLWQGNETRGYALVVNPYSGATHNEYSDNQIKQLKQYVDAAAAKMRDVGWGGMVSPDIANPADWALGQNTSVAGPFPTAPRHFHRAGGSQGARGYTISVGDGVRSWGDVNTNAYSTVQAAFQAAVDKIASTGNGGTIFVKRGAASYDWTSTTLTLSGLTAGLTICGDNDLTELRATGAVAVLTLAGASKVWLKNLVVSRSGAATCAEVVTSSASSIVHTEDCTIDGLRIASGTATGCTFTRTRFKATSASGSGVACRGAFIYSSWYDCYLTTDAAVAAGRAIQMDTAALYNALYRCRLERSNTTPTNVSEVAATTSTAFVDCLFSDTSGGSAGEAGVLAGAGALYFVRCQTASLDAGLVKGTNVTALDASECLVTFNDDNAGFSLLGTTAGKSYRIRGCQITQGTSSASSGTGVNVADVDGVWLNNCTFTDCDRAVYASGTNVKRFHVTDCSILTPTASRGNKGVEIDASNVYDVSINGVRIDGMDDSSVGTMYGVHVRASTAGRHLLVSGAWMTSLSTTATLYGAFIEGPLTDATVSDLRMTSCTGTGNAYGVVTAAVGTYPQSVTVKDCKFTSVDSTGALILIDVPGYERLCVVNNEAQTIGSGSVAGALYGVRFGSAVSSTQRWDVAVAGNVFYDFVNSSASDAIGIYGRDAVGQVAISGNSLRKIGGNVRGYGIVVEASAATFVEDIGIRGNIVCGTSAVPMKTCIVLNNIAGSTVSANTSISNNTLRHYVTYGISAVGASAESLQDCSVSSNTMWTNETTSPAGIYVFRGAGMVVSDNTIVSANAAATSDGIRADTPVSNSSWVVDGNRVWLHASNVTGFGINVITATAAGTATGNLLRNGSSGGSPAGFTLNGLTGSNNLRVP